MPWEFTDGYAKFIIFRLRHENDCWSSRLFLHSVKLQVKGVKLNGELQNMFSYAIIKRLPLDPVSLSTGNVIVHSKQIILKNLN